MKLLGAVLIWTSLSFLGVTYSIKLSKHVIILEETLTMLEEMEILLSYLNAPIYDMLFQISEKAYLEDLIYLKYCCQQMRNGTDFPLAWKISLKSTDHLYKNSEIEKLLQLGENLGTCDIINQLKIIKAQSENFKNYISDAKNKRKKYGNISTLLGILSGGMIFIVLI